MITSKGIYNSILYGLYAGLFLTAFFKVIQHFSSLRVYTLLLNVDYIPFLKEYTFPELIEVSFHLVISIVLSICLYIFLTKINRTTSSQVIKVSIGICLLIGAALYPTTAFSTRTPDLTNFPSIIVWLVGHAFYGYFLGILLKRDIVQ